VAPRDRKHLTSRVVDFVHLFVEVVVEYHLGTGDEEANQKAE